MSNTSSLPTACALALALCLGAHSAAAGQSATAARRGTVTGRVVDASGAAVPNAHVRLTPLSSPQAMLTAITDGDGAFRFGPLGADDYEIVVDAPYFSVARRTIRVDTPIEISIALETGRFSESLSVVGTRLGDSPATLRRLPGVLTILDAATLSGSQVFTATEALRKVPGVNVRDEEGFGLRPNIGIRGLNPTRSSKVLLLEDGVPFTIAPYGDNATYYHPPIERFESVEVLKGSGQIAYGPVTVGGIVNYVTPDVPKHKAATVRIAFGSRDYANVSGFAGTTLGRVGMSADYMRKQGDGARDNVNSRLDDLTGKVQVVLTTDHSLTVKANYYGENSTVTYSGLTEVEWTAAPRQNPFKNDAFLGDRSGVTATWRARFTNGLVMTTNVYQSSFRRHWWRQSSNSGQRPNDRSDAACGSMANLNTTCGNEGRLRQYDFWGVEPRFRATPSIFGLASETDFGIRFHAERQDRLQKNGETPSARDGVLVESNLRKNSAWSGFIQNRFLFGRLTVTPGLRVEEIWYQRKNRLTGVSGETSLTQVLPGIGAAVAPSSTLTIFGGLHRGFAPPRPEDVISNSTGGVVELDAELSWDTELGLRYAGTGLSADAAFFRMDYENQIVPASLAGGVGATLTNGGQTLHQGIEFGLRVDSAGLTGRLHNLFTRVAYTAVPTATFTGVRYSSVAGSSTVRITDHRLPYAPEHMLSLTMGYQHPVGLDAQVELVRVSDQFSDDLNSVVPSPDGQRGLIPASTIWNAAASWTIARLRSSVFVTLKNVGDTLYVADRSRGLLPGVPRLLQAGVRVRF